MLIFFATAGMISFWKLPVFSHFQDQGHFIYTLGITDPVQGFPFFAEYDFFFS